ncbi:unnamed protein product [Cladocopium goreaui]|uniref:3-hydroxyisobutyrate dehydrogenase, mitochondrial n=1 Tax=Cladocopium goreaui TaxID=2562237 RepID=A0A9P1D4M7_9DINO|nr:unnamed protein product [Cladocopium goreaui]
MHSPPSVENEQPRKKLRMENEGAQRWSWPYRVDEIAGSGLGDCLAITDDTRQITWSELSRASKVVAKSLKKLGLTGTPRSAYRRNGEAAEAPAPMVTMLPHNLESVIILLGVLRQGFPLLPLSITHNNRSQLLSRYEDAMLLFEPVAAVVTDTPTGQNLMMELKNFRPVLQVISASDLLNGETSVEDYEDVVTTTDHVLSYIFTSGSTGKSKCVVATNRMAWAECQWYPELFQKLGYQVDPRKDRWRLDHEMGWWGAAFFGEVDVALAMAMCIVMMKPTDPDWGHRGVTVSGALPSQLVQSCCPQTRLAHNGPSRSGPKVAPRARTKTAKVYVAPEEDMAVVGEAINVENQQVVGTPVNLATADKNTTSYVRAPEEPCCWEQCLIGTCFGPVGPCCACWGFFLLGWLFTMIFMREVVNQGTDIFSFEDPAVKSDIKVQEYYGLQAALGERPGCSDSAHEAEAVCNADEACVWETNPRRGDRCVDKECPGTPPRPREAPLYLDFLPAFISVIYEAQGENGNILDDDVLQVIMDYEKELFTDVAGAQMDYKGEKRASKWTDDWCLLSYPQLPMGQPKCASGVGPMNMFTMNAAGRATTKQQILSGHQMMGGGPIACMCGDSDACSICNADGSVLGAPATNNMTEIMMNAQSILAAWPVDVTQCILAFTASLESTMATMTTTTTTTTTTTSRDLFLENCALDQGFQGRRAVDLSDTNAYLAMVIATVVGQCASGNSCQLSPPGTSMTCASSAYYPATDAVGLVTAAEKEAILAKLCDPQQTLWFNAKNQFLPISFDCVGRSSKYAMSRFFAGAPTEDQEEDAKMFTTGYVEARNGWFQKAAQIEAKYEREHGTKLRIMLFSGATLIAQYLQILAIDGFLSFGSLISVWAYMWLMLESVFLASCGMFEIVFSLPVGMCLWVIIGQQKIFWYQMLVIYMILGIGADDVFILYDAWLQSAHVEGVKESMSHRFVWAYRRSAMAMLVTTLTTCGSFAIGATSPLPLVQSFCIFAAVVVLVDYLFCISFFAAAVLVYEKFMKGYGCCCSFCGIPVREPGTCLGPGCCWGGFRALFSCCGTSWKCMPKPQAKDAPLEKRAMERFFSGPVFRFYDRHKIKLIIFWLVVVVAMSTCAGVLLRTAKKQAPIGRENIDVIKGSEILFGEFEFSPTPETVSIAFGLNEAGHDGMKIHQFH